MSPGTLILGIFAILFGLVGAYGAKKYLQRDNSTPEAQAADELISVPLALRDLPEGRTVSIGDVTTARLTREQVREKDLPPSLMTNTSQVVGRTLCEPVERGKSFEPTLFYPDGVGPSVADRLETGQRAVTIPFEGSAAESGLITPGAMVDVLFRTLPDGQDPLPETTMTLLENVKVLAVGREIVAGMLARKQRSAGKATVTLAVTPLQAQALKVVEDRGTLTLVLRNGEDIATARDAGPTTLPDLLGIQEPEQPFKTEIYRRGHLTTIVFDEAGPQTIRETPFGMPIVGRPNEAETKGVSHTPVSGTSASSTSSQPCGCGSSTAQSVLVKK